MTCKGSKSSLDECITQIVKREHPQTVKQLVELVHKEYQLPQQTIIEHIVDLQSQGKLSFKKDTALLPLTLKNYLLSSYSHSYWTIIALALATTISVFTIPENTYPIVYVNYVLGAIFVLGLPGYSLIKILFPTKELNNIERIALSMGMSMVLTPVVGLLLSYTPWGMRTIPFTISLLTLTTLLATVAVLRERRAKLEQKQLLVRTSDPE